MSIGSGRDLAGSNALAGVEHRRESVSAKVRSLNMSFITGVSGDLKSEVCEGYLMSNDAVLIVERIRSARSAGRFGSGQWSKRSDRNVGQSFSRYDDLQWRRIESRIRQRKIVTCVRQLRHTFCLQTLHWLPKVNVNKLKWTFRQVKHS